MSEQTGAGTRVVVVEDHQIVREGLIALLRLGGFEVVGQAKDVASAVERVGQLRPDVVLMDVYLEGQSGIDAVRELRRMGVDTPVLMLTVSQRDSDLAEAIQAGANGYVLKRASAQEVFDAIRVVRSGHLVMPRHLAGTIVGHRAASVARSATDRLDQLSRREMEVLALLGAGRSNAEIATALVVTESTVKTHIHRIAERLGLQTRSELVAFAARQPLARPQHPL